MCRLNTIIVSSLPIVSTYITLLTHSPTVTGIIAIWNDIKTITKAYFLPITISYPLCFPDISWTSPRTIVLHASINIIWKLVIYINMVELCYRHITNKTPRLTTIFSNVHATIVSIYHEISIFWMNPPGMMIWMYTITHTVSRH